MKREQLLDKMAMECGSWDATVLRIPPPWRFQFMEGWFFIENSGQEIGRTDYLKRRKELINKPCWDEAPEWAEYLAQDADGSWCFYPSIPKDDGVYFGGQWTLDGSDIPIEIFREGSVPAGHEWRKTLERRPSSGTHYENTVACQRCGGGYFPEVHDECPCQSAASAHGTAEDESTSDGSTASYYELPEGATELQDLISYRNMNAQMGEIQRAVYRYGMASHSDQLRDAKKIKFYIEAEIARLERYGV